MIRYLWGVTFILLGTTTHHVYSCPSKLKLSQWNQTYSFIFPSLEVEEWGSICSYERVWGVCDNVERNQDKEIVRLNLFPFSWGISLRDQAKEWFTALKPWTISSWDDLTKEFYKKFFLMSRTTTFKRAIQLFEGKPNEPFHRVWERFKECVCVIPHHIFLKMVSCFYERVTPEQSRFLKYVQWAILEQRSGRRGIILMNLPASSTHGSWPGPLLINLE